MRIERIPITTDNSGNASVFSSSTRGLLYAVQLIDGDLADGVDITLTAETGDVSIPLYVKADFNVDKVEYPRVAEQDALDGSDLTTTTMPLVVGRAKAVVAAGGDTKSGAVLLYILDGSADFVRVQGTDIARPTVVITSSESSPTAADPIPVTVTFSETVAGFLVGDLVIANGTPANFTAVSGLVYTVNVSPTAPGAVTVNIAADVCVDASGNGNFAATQFSITAS